MLLTDIDERRRASNPRLRQAIKASTSWWAIMRHGKRGRTRAIPLDQTRRPNHTTSRFLARNDLQRKVRAKRSRV